MVLKLGTRRFVISYIYIYIHRSLSLKNAVCKLRDSYFVDQTLGYLGPYLGKSISSRFFFPCMDSSQVAYIIWILKPVNDFKTGRRNGFLGACGWITSAGHLSNLTIYDLKEQFSKLAPWNMHWPTVHFLQQHFVLVLSDECKQKTSGNSLAVRTFA